MNDAQREIFNQRINEYFNILDRLAAGEDVIMDKSLQMWGANVYNRYRYMIKGDRKNNALPLEHVKVLEKMLSERYITLESYFEIMGNREKLVQLIKENSFFDLSSYSLDELIKLRDDNEKKLNDLHKQHTPRGKCLYNLSDQEYEQRGKEIEKLAGYLKVIKDYIESKKVGDIVVDDNKKTRDLKCYNEKVQELMGTIEEKDKEISRLTAQNEHLIKERDSFVDKIKSNYEEKLSNEMKSYSSKYEKVIADKDKKFSEELSKYDKVIAAKDRKFREYKDNVQDKFAEQERIIFDRSHELYEQQKALVVDLLCSNDVVSLDDIRNLFKSKDMTLDNISSIIKDIRCEIPGLVRNMDNGEFVFSIDSNSIRTCNEYKGWDLSPKISNVHDGVIRFVVRSDLHFGLLSNLDDMKRAFYSHMDFCSKSGNIPIIDLGDICDTLGKASIDDWRSIDKDVVKKAYEFYKNYALAISSASNINNFVLFGNHDIHPYLCGLDPLEIIEGYSDNFKFLGVTNGSFRLGDDKVGVFHDAKMVPYIATIDKFKIKQYVCDSLCEEIKSISSDYIYSLFGHYHFGIINPECGFAVVDSGLGGSLLFDAYISDSHVDRMIVTPLQYIDGKIYKSYEIEIYNRGKSFAK